MTRLERLIKVVREEQAAATAAPTPENLDSLRRTQDRLFNYAIRSGRNESVPYELFFAPKE